MVLFLLVEHTCIVVCIYSSSNSICSDNMTFSAVDVVL